jgi:LysM repeat protein
VNTLSFKRRFLFLSVVILLTVTACERPVPRENTPEAGEPAPTADVIIIPTAPPEGDEAYPPAGEETTAEPPSTEATPPATVEETPAAPTDQEVIESGGEVTHVVAAGETLGQIAQLYGVSVEDIAAANNISNVDALEVGQTLIIKAGAAVEAQPTETTGEQIHVVQAGENLFRIGLRYGFTPEELAAYNNIPDITRIDVGQVIKIPPK